MALNLNQEAQFAVSPLGVGINRSKLGKDTCWTGTFNAGVLNVPFWDEVLPGDTKKISMKALIRMTTPLAPVMDDCYLDAWAFFVPWRLVWDHVEEFFGANNENYWIQPQEYTFPTIDMNNATVRSYRFVGDLADQIGIPYWDGTQGTSITDGNVGSLLFRSYRLIWNEFFRDENTQAPVLVNTSDSDTMSFDLPSKLLPVNRFHDYFGSCLPGPLKHSPIRAALTGILNVYPTADSTLNLDTSLSKVSAGGILWKNSSNGNIASGADLGVGSVSSNGNSASQNGGTFSNARPIPGNLVVDLNGGSSTGLDINTLRTAIATQRIYEALGIGGSRFTEILQSFWSVTSPDARLQRPELLAHARRRISMSEVAQTSPTLGSGDAVSTPLGTIGAFSKTYSDGLFFEKSFSEYGYIIICMAVRTSRSYCQGISRLLRHQHMLDVYNPKLAFIGEQPVRKDELYAAAPAGSTFGYQEAFAWYRMKPSIVSGYCSPAVPLSIGHEWTYSDFYTGEPFLDADWMKEGDDRIKRTLAVQELDLNVPAPDFVGQFYFDYDDIRAMPVHSIPGLMDHF